MTRVVDVDEAKLHLSQLVERAADGETFVIAKAGRPMDKVVPVDRPAATRRIGFLEGAFDFPDDFDRMGDEEIAEVFEGRDG